MSILALAAALLAAAPLDLGAPLDWGSHTVGFRRLAAAASPVSAWYPAAGAPAPIHFAEYLGAERQAFADFLRGAGLAQPDVEAYLGAPMRATLDAPAAPGDPPLALLAQGNREDAADQAVLAEYLASHGYLVLSTPSPMLASPMTDESQIGSFAARQADDLAAALRRGSAAFGASARRIGVIGHSFGARAALLWAMREPRVAVLVSLDGGIATAVGAASLRAAPGFDAARCPPILHLYETLDEFMRPDFTFLESLHPPRLERVELASLHHAHFTTLGFAAGALPALAAASHAGPSARADLAALARHTRQALDAAARPATTPR